MLNLTLQHIDQLRNYFLASTEEEKHFLQNNISPSFVRSHLENLKEQFIYDPNNEDKLLSVYRSMGAIEHIEILKEIKQQFYSHLAQLYLKGTQNNDIAELLRVNNTEFMEALDFQKNLQFAFIINEREYLKSKFKEIDRENDINQSEYQEVFKRIEREKLKAKFDELDSYQEKKRLAVNYAMPREWFSYETYSNKSGKKKRRFSSLKFNLTKLAVAACVIGLIIATTIFVLNKKNNGSQLANNNTTKSIDTNHWGLNHENQISKPLTGDTLKYFELQLPALKNESSESNSKQEILFVRLYAIKEKIIELEKVLIKKEAVGDGPAASVILNSCDSIKSLYNKYIFNGQAISLYLTDESEPKFYKLADQYYVKIGINTYNIAHTPSLRTLYLITDKAILDKIDKIELQEN